MKRIVFLFFSISFLCSQPCNAQPKIGAFFQPSFDVHNAENIDYNYSLGINSQFILSEKLSTTLGIGFEKYSSDLSGLIRFGDKIYPVEHSSHLIKLEGYMNYILKSNENLSFYLLGGPNLNFSFNQQTDLAVLNEFKMFNALVAAGVGFEIKKSQFSINIEPVFKLPFWTNETNLAILPSYRAGLRISANLHLGKS